MGASKTYTMNYELTATQNASVNKAFTEAQACVKQLQTEIVSLNKTQSDISAYQKQASVVDEAATKSENLRKQLENLKAAAAESGEESYVMANKVLQMEQRVASAEATEAKQVAKLQEMESALKTAGVDTDNLADESGRLATELEELKAQEQAAAEAATQMGDQGVLSVNALANAWAGSGIAKAINEVIDAYKECISTFADFESSMSKVEALSGATTEELEALSDMAQTMGATTAYTASEAADALSYMALAGWDTEAMLNSLESVLNLAAASSMDLATASDIVTDYITAFGLSSEDAAQFVDMMAYAQANSNTTTAQLGEAYKNCASTAASMGYEVNEVTAVLMTMANAGVKGGEAGTALNTIMTRLATDTKGCASALAEYGVEIYDAQGNMKSLSSILEGMSGVWSTLNDEQQASLAKTIAGTSQYSSLMTIMNGLSVSASEAGQSFSDYAAALEECSGTASEQASTMLDNLNGKLTLFSSALDGLELAVGEELAPAMAMVVQTGTDALGAITDLVTSCPGLVTILGAVTGALALATAGFAAYHAAMALATMGTLAALGPVTLVAAGLGALAGVAVILQSTVNELTEETAAFASEAQEMAETVEAARTAFADTLDTIEAESDSLSDNIDRLEELTSKTELTAAEQVELAAVIDTLNEGVEGLNLSYDEQTGLLTTTTEAIRAMVDAQQEQAEYQAKVERYTELLAEQSEIETELAGKTEELSDAWAECADEAQNYSGIWNQSTSAAYQNAQNLQSGIDALTDSYAQNESELAELEAYINGYAEATEDGAAATAAATEAVEGMVEGLAELVEAYQETYEEALETYSGMFSLFDEAQADADATVEAAKAALDSQLSYWTSYAENMSILKSMSAEDLNLTEENYYALMTYVQDGSEEAAGLAASMVEAIQNGDTEAVTDLGNTIAEVSAAQQTAAEITADWVTDLENQAQELVDAFEDAVADMELSSEAQSAGEETMSAYVDGLSTYASKAITVAQQTAAKVSAALAGSTSTTTTVTAHAEGGIMTSPHLGLVAEDGPEAIIPLSAGKSDRGMELWLQAGQLLGVQAYADGGVVGRTSAAAAMQNGSAATEVYTINFAPTYNVSGTDGSSLRTTLESFNGDLRTRVETILDEVVAERRRRAY